MLEKKVGFFFFKCCGEIVFSHYIVCEMLEIK